MFPPWNGEQLSERTPVLCSFSTPIATLSCKLYILIVLSKLAVAMDKGECISHTSMISSSWSSNDASKQSAVCPFQMSHSLRMLSFPAVIQVLCLGKCHSPVCMQGAFKHFTNFKLNWDS